MSSKDQPNQSDIEPEGFKRHATEDADTEGHMPFKRVTEPGPDEPGAGDTEAHVIQATDDPGIEPEGGKYRCC